MEKINLFYSIRNAGDGSCYLVWFLTQKEATEDQDNQDEGWGEDCSGKVETFEGSNIHKDALEQLQKKSWG